MSTHTHYLLTDFQRTRRGDDCMNDRAYSSRRKASYLHRGQREVKTGSHNTGYRSWSNSTKDRHNGGYHYFGPGWILPRVLATVTASVVWGHCGAMADMPEY